MEKSPESIRNICRASIRRNAGDATEWMRTFYYEDLHEEKRTIIESEIRMEENELPIVACFLSHKSWLVVTTRRVIGRYYDDVRHIHAAQISKWHWEGFRGYRKKPTITISLTVNGGEVYNLETATGNESRAILSGIRYIVGVAVSRVKLS